MKYNLTDYSPIRNMRQTGDGYLAGSVRVARSGIQEYYGSELGRPDKGILKLYRPPEEVFKKDSLRSIAHKPITLDHPSESVTADNWKQYAIGQVGDEVARDGEFVRVPMSFMDSSGINAIKEGTHREISLGYSCDIVWQAGKTEDGIAYDAIQTGIRCNHVAVVDQARGGNKLRIGDVMTRCQDCGNVMDADSKECSSCGATNKLAWMEPDDPDDDDNTSYDSTRKKLAKLPKDSKDSKGVRLMNIMIDGLPVELVDKDAAIVQRHIAKLEKDIATADAKAKKAADDEEAAEEKLRKQTDAANTEIETLKGKVVALEKSVSDSKLTAEKLDELVKDRSTVIDAARAILGDKAKFEGKELADIKRMAVASKIGDEPAKAMSDDAVSGAFEVISADSKKAGSGHRRLADSLTNANKANVSDDAEAAYNESVKRVSDAWRGPNRQLVTN